jgi:L-asparaginase
MEAVLKEDLMAAVKLQADGSREKPVVRFIATGGTIAMKVDPLTQGVVPAIAGDDLMASIPDAGRYARIEVDNFSNITANYITNDWWAKLTRSVTEALSRPEVAGAVVAQGTDTLEETAYWLDLTVDSAKPVVLIGAQRNASSPDFDGPRNLLNAIRIAVCREARGKGVMVAMNNQINAARSVTKTHTANVETFQGGNFGWLGEVWDDRVVFSRAPLRRMYVPIVGEAGEDWPAVHIFPMYAGADGMFIRHAVDNGTRGVVVQAAGMGNMNVSMFEAVKYALAKGVPVVVATRVPNGRTMPVYGYDGGGKTTFDAGAIMAGDLNPQKAKILLTLLLHNGVRDCAALRDVFDR